MPLLTSVSSFVWLVQSCGGGGGTPVSSIGVGRVPSWWLPGGHCCIRMEPRYRPVWSALRVLTAQPGMGAVSAH